MKKKEGASKVTVTKHKLDGTGRSWRGEQLQVDEYGTWIFIPVGTEVRRPNGDLLPALNSDVVQLLTPGQWWVASWIAEPYGMVLDVIEPLKSSGSGEVSYLDLELDLWWRDGAGEIVDQDELQHALDQGWLTQDMATHAETVANQLLARLQSSDPLLTSIGFRMLEQALDAHPLPPSS